MIEILDRKFKVLCRETQVKIDELKDIERRKEELFTGKSQRELLLEIFNNLERYRVGATLPEKLADVEDYYISMAMLSNHGNASQTAKQLGICRRNMFIKLRKNEARKV